MMREIGMDRVNETRKQMLETVESTVLTHGLVLDFTVAENLVLQNYDKEPFAKKGILHKNEIAKHASYADLSAKRTGTL